MSTERADRLIALESIRGIAALIIVVYHTAYQPARPFPAAADPWLAPWGLYSLPMFFVLSAFVLWHGYVADDGRLRGGVLHFYRRRFFRIAPLFYLLIAVHILFIYPFSQVQHLMLSSLTFTYNLVPGQHPGFVLAGWSIGVEVIFYVLLPVLALVMRRWWVVLGAFVGLTACAAYAGRGIVGLRRMAEWRQWNSDQADAYASFAFNALFFAAGLLALLAFRRVAQERSEIRLRSGRLALGGAAIAMVVLAWLGADAPFANRWAWALALAALVFGLAAAPPRFMEHRVVRWPGARSYSLYLLHGPMIVLLERCGFIGWADATFGWVGVPISALAVAVLTLAGAAITYRFVEVPGMKLGGRSPVVEPRAQKTPAG